MHSLAQYLAYNWYCVPTVWVIKLCVDKTVLVNPRISFRQKIWISLTRVKFVIYADKYHLGHSAIQIGHTIWACMHYRHGRLKPELNITRELTYGLDLWAKPVRLPPVNTCLHVFAEISNTPKGEPLSFRDCAEILRSGVTESGIYNIRLPNSTQTIKVVRF